MFIVDVMVTGVPVGVGQVGIVQVKGGTNGGAVEPPVPVTTVPPPAPVRPPVPVAGPVPPPAPVVGPVLPPVPVVGPVVLPPVPFGEPVLPPVPVVGPLVPPRPGVVPVLPPLPVAVPPPTPPLSPLSPLAHAIPVRDAPSNRADSANMREREVDMDDDEDTVEQGGRAGFCIPNGVSACRTHGSRRSKKMLPRVPAARRGFVTPEPRRGAADTK
jgi:hypothetical protein